MKRILIQISGRGSNMRSLVEACDREGWDARVVAVLSNRPDAAGLAWAAEHGIATQVVDHRAHRERDAFDAALADAIDRFEPDVVANAGFMRILGEPLVRRYAGRMVNIHPSLLPAFAGLDVHRRVLAAGCKVSGATVHFVTPQVDGGPIIAQAAVPVLSRDTEASLAARVLAREHVLYPRALRWLVHDELRVDDGIVTHQGGEAQLF